MITKSSHEPPLYQCDECKLFYRKEETAKRCEAWCSEHKSCNLDIIKDAVDADS